MMLFELLIGYCSVGVLLNKTDKTTRNLFSPQPEIYVRRETRNLSNLCRFTHSILYQIQIRKMKFYLLVSIAVLVTVATVTAELSVRDDHREDCGNFTHLQCTTGRLHPLLVILRGIADKKQIENGCYKSDRQCDDFFDCQDKSDEIGCSKTQEKCPVRQFECDDGSCISRERVCDHVIDCLGGNDESVACYGKI